MSKACTRVYAARMKAPDFDAMGSTCVVVDNEHVGIAAGGGLKEATGEIAEDLAGGRGKVGGDVVRSLGGGGGGGCTLGGRKSLASARSAGSRLRSVNEATGREGSAEAVRRAKGERGMSTGATGGVWTARRLVDWRLARHCWLRWPLTIGTEGGG